MRHYERSIAFSRETGFSWWEIGVLLTQAMRLFDLGRPADAARSSYEALEAEIERAPMAEWDAESDEIIQPMLARAGAPFEMARAEGGALSLDDAAELALAEG